MHADAALLRFRGAERVEVVLRDLRDFLVGPDPPVRPRTRLGRSLPTIGVIAAIVCGLITYESLLGNEPKVATGFLVIDAVLIAAPIGLVATRSLFAWRIAFLVAGFPGLTVPIRVDTPWPWTPVQMLMFPLLLAVVAVRHRRGVLVWTGLSAALLLVMFVNPGNLAGLLLGVAAVLVIGDQVRRRREVQAALAEEAERTELAAGPPRRRRGTQPDRPRDARRRRPPHVADRGARRDRRVPHRRRPDRRRGGARRDRRHVPGGPGRDAPPARGAAQHRDDALFEPQPVLDDLDRAGPRRRARPASTSPSTRARRRVPAAVGLAAFRIVQEALSNARRHAAGAGRAHHPHRDRPHWSCTCATRPGGPHRRPPAGQRHGLLGMRERATRDRRHLSAGPRPRRRVHRAAPLPLGRSPT